MPQEVTLTPYEQRQRRRSLLMGIVTVIAGLALSIEAVESIRTGVPIHTLNGHLEINGWIALAGNALCVFFGATLVVVTLRERVRR